MSSEWPHVKLGSLADFQEGYVNPSQREPSYFDGPVKWLRATDLNDGLVTNTSRTLSDKGFNSAGKSAVLFKPGSLAISKSGTIGRLGLLGDHMCGNRAVINIKPKPNSVPRYLFFVLRHLRPTIETLAEGSVQKNLYVSVLSCLDVPAPPKELQQAIADILGVLDDRITLLRETNNTLEAVAQALFKSWFVDFDPVHAKMQGRDPEGMDQATVALFPDSFEESELGHVPKGWRVERLGDVVERVTKGTTPTTLKRPFMEKGINFVKAESMTDDGGFLPEKFAYIDDETHELLKRSQLQDGDVLISIAGTIGRSAVITEDFLPANTNQAVALIRPKQDVFPSGLLWRFLKQENSMQLMGERVVQAVQANLSLGTLSDIRLVLPPKGLTMKLFEIAFSAIDESKALNSQKVRVLSALRDTLLPRLISGQLRVNSVAELAES